MFLLNLRVIILFLLLTVSWTPLISYYLFSTSYTILFLSLGYILVSVRYFKLNYSFLLGLILVVIMILVATVFVGRIEFIFRFFVLPLALVVSFLIIKDFSLLHKLVDILTIYAVFSGVLSVLAAIYFFSGGEPFFVIQNPDLRYNNWYLSSFSNHAFNQFIRPSFLYDEPGAFSFFLYFVVFIREITKKNKDLSLLILTLGLVTLSLTHFILYFFFIIFRYKFWRLKYLICFISLFLLCYDFFLPVFDRLSFEDGWFRGDNRIGQITNFLDIIDLKLFFWGNLDCYDRPNSICIEHGDISSSIVTPVYLGGILGLFIQLVTHSILIVLFFTKRFKFVSFSLTMLLVQRPYFNTGIYSIFIFIVIFLLFFKCFKEEKMEGVC